MSNLPTHCDSLSQTLCLSMVWHDATANVFAAWQHCAYERPKSTNTYYYLMWVRRHSSSYRVVITLSVPAMLKNLSHLLWSVCVSQLGFMLGKCVFVFQFSSMCMCVCVWAAEVVAGTALNPNRWRRDCVGGLNLHHAEDLVAAVDCVGCGRKWLLIQLKSPLGRKRGPKIIHDRLQNIWIVNLNDKSITSKMKGSRKSTDIL